MLIFYHVIWPMLPEGFIVVVYILQALWRTVSLVRTLVHIVLIADTKREEYL